MGIITKEMVKTWQSLRNESAHANKIELNNLKLQKNFNQYFTCLSLYYLILFNIIGYNKKFRNYSKEDWPVEEVP